MVFMRMGWSFGLICSAPTDCAAFFCRSEIDIGRSSSSSSLADGPQSSSAIVEFPAALDEFKMDFKGELPWFVSGPFVELDTPPLVLPETENSGRIERAAVIERIGSLGSRFAPKVAYAAVGVRTAR